MAARKRTTKKRPAREDVYLIPEEDEPTPEALPLTIETDVTIDSIEFKAEEDEKASEPRYYVSFHLELPEHIAQQFFAHHVQEGRATVEFHPANPELRRKGLLVRR